MNIESIIDTIDRGAKREAGDYEQDGLLYCGHCKTQKQCRIQIGGRQKIVGCVCACEERRYQAERKADEEREMMEKIERLRVNGIRDKTLKDNRFENAEDCRPIRGCKRYVDNWDKMSRDNTGLIFWGDTGSGKTFCASCIVNALIDKGIPAMMTSFPKLLNQAGYDKMELIEQMNNYKLVVIDDLGVERSSQYALECVYLAIDERVKSGLPMIITTNLSLQQIQNPEDMEYKRIYDRILSVCVPIRFSGESRRKKQAEERAREIKSIF